MPEGLRLARLRVQAIAGLALAIALTLGTANAQKVAISFVQVNSATPQKQSSVTVSYSAAQTAGDLNVVAVGWNDSTATISSVADSAGNTYAVAAGPTVQSGTATQAIYYAKNIVAAAANSNRVTVTFSVAATYPDIRIAEYSGLDPSNPVDVAVAAEGTSTSGSSGSVTTTNANDLLVGASLVQTQSTAAGTGYTSRVITVPDGDILEDRVVATTGSYSATASISPSGKWIMQMAAFRAAGSGAGTSPSISSVSPSSGPVGTSVTVTGTNFGSTQGTSKVTFNGTVATPTSWSATSIVAPVPTGATTGNILVTVSGVASNGVSFTVATTSPSITSLNPSSGPVGTSVTITGTNFGSSQGTSKVTFNGTVATPTSWSATSIVVTVPNGATTGNVVVTVSSLASNGVNFTVTATSPNITGLNPSSGPVGTSVTIAGTNFGSTQGTSTVTFNGAVATPTSWSATSIVVPVPTGATTGNVLVTVGGQASNGVSFTVATTSPSITSLSPTSGPVGTSVTITGTNFGATQGASTITFNGTVATPMSWSATSIVAPVPAGATTGNVVVTVGGQASNGASFTVSIISSGEPTLIQHVSSSNTRSIDLGSPFCYYFQLPNPTTSGNAVIVGVTFGSISTPTVTDDQGDSYTVVENHYDSADIQSVAIAAAFNVSAGARNISVCFSSDPGGWVQPMATEFNNVVAVDGSGTASQGTGTSVTAGTLTPGVSGDLAYQVVFSTSANQSSFTAGSQGNITWNLLSADLMDGWAGQYGVYNSTSATNPTMSMGTSENWLSAAILLQVGTAGSVPSGMRIVHLVHENIPFHEASGGNGSFPNPLPLQFPSSGNLLVAMIGGGYYTETVTSITDRNNNAWIQAGSTFVIADNDTVQTYFAGNATSSGNLGLTVKWSGTGGDFTILFYDVTGAAITPLDTTNGATGLQSSTSGTLTVPYTLTPAQSGELIFTDIIWDANTGTGLTSNTGTSYFDTNTFSGESLSGPEPVDENNGWGHVISTSTSPISFTWSQLSTTLPAGNWASMAVAFLAADPPGN